MERRPDEITRILAAMDGGESGASERLLPLVYEELRDLARVRMNREPAGMTLQPTALVHEVYLRLVNETGVRWQNRAHFFAAAAEAMRRILIERARHRARLKHGGGRQKLSMEDLDVAGAQDPVDYLALDDALNKLQAHDARLAEVVKLRFFAGLSTENIAELMGVSSRTIKRDWEFARAWLYAELAQASGMPPA